MSLYEFEQKKPTIGEGCFIADSADVIGDVVVEDGANLWFNVVARGDVNKIFIGKGTNIQDLTMLHVIESLPLIIGEGVSVGHNVILHACTIENNCLIGMGAIVLDGALIGHHSVVAAGSIVPPGKRFPPGSMIMGSPAKVVRELTEEERENFGEHFQSYVGYSKQFLDKSNFKKIDS